MPRVHASLPQELYDQMKSHGWSPSEVLQDAIRERIAAEERQRQNDEWYEELASQLGPPSEEQDARLERWVRAKRRQQERGYR